MEVPTHELTRHEINLHTNIGRYLFKAKEVTVLIWLQLLRNACSDDAIQRKQKIARKQLRMQSIMAYFKKCLKIFAGSVVVI